MRHLVARLGVHFIHRKHIAYVHGIMMTSRMESEIHTFTLSYLSKWWIHRHNKHKYIRAKALYLTVGDMLIVKKGGKLTWAAQKPFRSVEWKAMSCCMRFISRVFAFATTFSIWWKPLPGISIHFRCLNHRAFTLIFNQKQIIDFILLARLQNPYQIWMLERVPNSSFYVAVGLFFFSFRL